MEGVEHEGEEGEPMKAGEAGGEAFIVARETAETARPGKGSLDHPASGQEHKAALGLVVLDDLQADSMFSGRMGRILSRVALIDKGEFDVFSRGRDSVPAAVYRGRAKDVSRGGRGGGGGAAHAGALSAVAAGKRGADRGANRRVRCIWSGRDG